MKGSVEEMMLKMYGGGTQEAAVADQDDATKRANILKHCTRVEAEQGETVGRGGGFSGGEKHSSTGHEEDEKTSILDRDGRQHKEING